LNYDSNNGQIISNKASTADFDKNRNITSIWMIMTFKGDAKCFQALTNAKIGPLERYMLNETIKGKQF
jgi:hypothetical protein